MDKSEKFKEAAKRVKEQGTAAMIRKITTSGTPNERER